MVFHRMVEIKPKDRKYPECVYKGKNGEDYKRMVFYDFNSLVSILKFFELSIYEFFILVSFRLPTKYANRSWTVV